MKKNMNTCKEDKCNSKYYANGYCSEHNDYYWRKPSYKTKFNKKCRARNCNKKVCRNDYCTFHQSKVNKRLDPNILYNKLGGGKSDYPNHYQMKKVRKKKLELIGNFCEECGIEKPSSKLDIHHLDESKDNHIIENILLLCRKCHLSIYHSGRPYRGKKKHNVAYLKELVSEIA